MLSLESNRNLAQQAIKIDEIILKSYHLNWLIKNKVVEAINIILLLVVNHQRKMNLAKEIKR